MRISASIAMILVAGVLGAPAAAADYGHRKALHPHVIHHAPSAQGAVAPGYGHAAYHKGRYTATTYRARGGNHPWKSWTYPSTYPWAQPVVYNAGPGNYYPAHKARMKQARHGHRWTGYPPQHLYVTDYNGYAPQYGFYPHE